MSKSTNLFRQKQRALNDFEIEKIIKIKNKADELLELFKMEGKSEEEIFFKEARKNLELTVMWATKAITT